MRAGDNSAALWGNVHARDELVVALQFILELEGIANSAVQVNRGVARNGQCLAIRRERVIRDRVVEQVMDFWSCHDEL